ncbi:MAG: dihydroorotate dehydrogenase electron transfer subunit, partial [Povalibacter sp.]
MNTPDTPLFEEVEVLSQAAAGDQFILRVKAPALAAAARPGNHIQLRGESGVSALLPIMRARTQTGVLELLYRTEGSDLEALSSKQAGDRLHISLRSDKAFVRLPERPRTLVVADELGIAPSIFLSEVLYQQKQLFVLLGSSTVFPFRPRPSTILVPGIPDGVIACMPMLDEWGVPSRLASSQDLPGCFDGSVVDLALLWLTSLDSETREQVEVFASGAAAMTAALMDGVKTLSIPGQE